MERAETLEAQLESAGKEHSRQILAAHNRCSDLENQLKDAVAATVTLQAQKEAAEAKADRYTHVYSLLVDNHAF
jgi:hypothetical protein